ncbi:MAG: hypothetical protein AMXMBFR72_00550 [Betaproteobacteria bacterium]
MRFYQRGTNLKALPLHFMEATSVRELNPILVRKAWGLPYERGERRRMVAAYAVLRCFISRRSQS